MFNLPSFCSNDVMDGKIWLLWNIECKFDMVKMSNQMILGWLWPKGSKVLAMFIYAKCSSHEHKSLWVEFEDYWFRHNHGLLLRILITLERMVTELKANLYNGLT